MRGIEMRKTHEDLPVAGTLSVTFPFIGRVR
jgi:hypothetical protein